jgi:hypothetical protein
MAAAALIVAILIAFCTARYTRTQVIEESRRKEQLAPRFEAVAEVRAGGPVLVLTYRSQLRGRPAEQSASGPFRASPELLRRRLDGRRVVRVATGVV